MDWVAEGIAAIEDAELREAARSAGVLPLYEDIGGAIALDAELRAWVRDLEGGPFERHELTPVWRALALMRLVAAFPALFAAVQRPANAEDCGLCSGFGYVEVGGRCRACSGVDGGRRSCADCGGAGRTTSRLDCGACGTVGWTDWMPDADQLLEWRGTP